MPTGRDIVLEGIDLFGVRAGRIEELRRFYDLLDLRSQLYGTVTVRGHGTATTSGEQRPRGGDGA